MNAAHDAWLTFAREDLRMAELARINVIDDEVVYRYTPVPSKALFPA